MSNKGEKIQKFLASSGIGSRRACEVLVEECRVSINDSIASIGDRVSQADDVRLDGRRIKKQTAVFWKLNKPSGYLCTDNIDQTARRARLLIPDRKTRLFSVGRLDKDFEGLILFTNDGHIANQLMHPRYRVSKIYEVRVNHYVPDESVAKIKKGIWLSDGKTAPLEIRIRKRSQKRTLLTMEMTENRRRLIPRIFSKLEHPLDRVKRIAVGPIKIRGLKEGEARKLDSRELTSIKKLMSPNSVRNK